MKKSFIGGFMISQRLLKSTASLLLAILMFVSVFAANVPAIDVGRKDGLASVLKNWGNYPKDGVSKDVDWDGLVDAVYARIKTYDTNVDVSRFGITTTDENRSFLSDLIYSTPKFLRLIKSYSYSHRDGKILSLNLTYKYSKSDSSMAISSCNKVVSKITSDLKHNYYLSDAEKLLLVKDRIDTLSEYNYSDYLAEKNGSIDKMADENYSAYGILVLRNGVCSGYASAYAMCLDELGIKSYCVESDKLNHAWNIVYLDGEPYFVDSTWDDPIWDVCGRATHNNFLVSTSKLKQNHVANDYPTLPVSTYYDDFYWTCSDTAFQLIGNNLYYIDNINGKLCRRNSNGTTTVLKDLDFKWYSNSRGSYWTKNYSKLSSYAGWLIYSTPTQVCAYNVSTGETETLLNPPLNTGENYYIFGMTVIDCMLFIDVNNTPNFDENTKNNQIRVELSHMGRYVSETKKTFCTDTGYTSGTVCEICGKVLNGRVKIAPTEHVWGPKQIVAEASPTEDGKLVCSCANCPAKKTTTLAKVSKISLSKTVFDYNGKVRKPSVTVKNRTGNEIPSKYYTIKWSDKDSKSIGKYYVKVRFKSPYSGSKKLSYCISPLKVKDLEQTNVTETTVSLKWSAAKYAKYYQVHMSKDNGKTWEKVAVVSKAKATVKSLSPGKKYLFRVRALDETKKVAGRFSEDFRTQTLCAAPKISSLKSNEPTGVTVKWKAVTGAKKYAVAWSVDGKTWKVIGTTTETQMGMINFYGGSKVRIKVRAINAYGQKGAYSAVKSVTVMK